MVVFLLPSSHSVCVCDCGTPCLGEVRLPPPSGQCCTLHHHHTAHYTDYTGQDRNTVTGLRTHEIQLITTQQWTIQWDIKEYIYWIYLFNLNYRAMAWKKQIFRGNARPLPQIRLTIGFMRCCPSQVFEVKIRTPGGSQGGSMVWLQYSCLGCETGLSQRVSGGSPRGA